MIPDVIGFCADVAQAELASAGFAVRCIEYISRRGVPDADAARVIRQRYVENNTVELTISDFKTRIQDSLSS